MLETALELLKVYGLPTAFLVVVSIASWKIVNRLLEQLNKQTADEKKALTLRLKAKIIEISRLNEEIKRLNEERLEFAQNSGERMLTVATEFHELTTETNTTLALLADRMQMLKKK